MDGYSLFLDPMGNSQPACDEKLAPFDRETQIKSAKVANGLSETILLLANEPSLGLYRLQEHIRRSVPALVDLKKDMAAVNVNVQGAVHDAEYAVSAIQKMHNLGHIARLERHMLNAIKLRKQYNEQQAAATEAGAQPADVAAPSSIMVNNSPDLVASSPAEATVPTTIPSPADPVSAAGTTAASPPTAGDGKASKKKKKKKAQTYDTQDLAPKDW